MKPFLPFVVLLLLAPLCRAQDAAARAAVAVTIANWTPADLAAFVDARIDAKLHRASAASPPTMSAACIPNGDGTYSCPMANGGTCVCTAGQCAAMGCPTGAQTYAPQAAYAGQHQAFAADDGADDAAPAKRVRFHLFGRPHRR